MTHFEIIKKLIGPIKPVGESRADEERLENLKEWCKVTECLINEIKCAAFDGKDRYEYSMKQIGEYAVKFLREEVATAEI